MDIGKMLIATGIILIIFGFLFSNISGLPRLPGDIYIKRDNFTFYFPIVTSVVISIFLTIVLHFFFRK
ncbi:MAG: DUF2905 domain-containing protein [Candidatus Levybacteria bacterium]|nr:DUF2905 domain-containing protein [Candidatus Levybacteria bacterium]